MRISFSHIKKVYFILNCRMIFPLPKEHNLNLRRYLRIRQGSNLSVFTEEKIIDFYYWFLTSPELELKRQ